MKGLGKLSPFLFAHVIEPCYGEPYYGDYEAVEPRIGSQNSPFQRRSSHGSACDHTMIQHVITDYEAVEP
jgi:hypothetical protein